MPPYTQTLPKAQSDPNHSTKKELFSQLITAVHGVATAINKLTLQLSTTQMLDPVKLGTFFSLVTQLLQTDSSQQTTITSLKQQISDLTASEAALNDPALETQLETLSAAAAAAVAPPTTTAPPALWDAAINYTAGSVVSDAQGDTWTAVSPVLGEAPGVNPANWTETTIAPAPAAGGGTSVTAAAS